MNTIQEKTEQAAMDRMINEMKVEVEEESHHPLLGAPLVDLGDKTIYSVSIKSLRSIPVWERQRAYRHKRAEIMAKEKMKRKDSGLLQQEVKEKRL